MTSRKQNGLLGRCGRRGEINILAKRERYVDDLLGFENERGCGVCCRTTKEKKGEDVTGEGVADWSTI